MTDINRYAKGKIYCIRSHQTNRVYIGSTINTLTKRFSNHKKDYRTYQTNNKAGTYCSSFEILKYEDCYIELIENYPCIDKNELVRREGQTIRDTPNVVNINIAGRTVLEYREDNKQRIAEQKREYYEANKLAIIQKSKDYYEANKSECVGRLRQYYEAHKAEVCEKSRAYYKAHKGELCKKRKEYYNAHKGRISEMRRKIRQAKHKEHIDNNPIESLTEQLKNLEPLDTVTTHTTNEQIECQTEISQI